MLARKPLVQKSLANVESLPAPVGGWNARDSLANMDPMDAVVLTNFFPTPSNVVLRGGSTKYATGMNGLVQTLMDYNSGAVNKFFAIDSIGKSIYDISSPGAVGAPVVTGLTNAYWEYANITTGGGGYLLAVNGLDHLQRFDGTTWLTITGSGTGAITGVDTSALDNIVLFKERLWFLQKNTLNAWYLDTEAVAGAAHLFSLQSVARKGGYLAGVGTWTIDAGYGVDDYLVFVTSQGEVIVYGGTDPSSADTFALVGIWQLGLPMGHRCCIKYGGDILIITQDGLLPLAQALQSSRLDPRVALSDKIQGAISEAVQAYGTAGAASLGWQIFYYPSPNAVWINIPIGVGQQQQYVMNTITKSWCNFTGWNANVFELSQGVAYFGDDSGNVWTAWDGTYGDQQANIDTMVLQAFNYFQLRGVEKYFTRARPAIFTNGSPALSIGINVDFDIEDNLGPITFTASSVGSWDVAKWDQGKWGQNLVITNNWQGIGGLGYCGAIALKSASSGVQIEWAATDVVFQTGWRGI